MRGCGYCRPTRTSRLGSWVPDETGLSFAAFYPSAVREGLAINLFLGMVLRVRWAAGAVFGEEGSARRAVWAGR